MATFLLTGGRAPATLDLARLLHATGHRVVVAESLANHLCSHSRAVAANYRVPPPAQDHKAFTAELARIAERENADWIVPTCEEVFWVAHGNAYPCPVLSPPLETLRRLHDKGAFIERVRMAGLPTPETWRVHSDEELIQVRTQNYGKMVLKPAFSRFSTRLSILHPGIPAPRLTTGEAWIVQQFIAGTPVSTWGVAHAGRLLAHVAYPANFTAGTGACIDFRVDPDPTVEKWVVTMVAAEAYTGLVGFDFIRDEQGHLWPLECNPRATSGIHLFTPEDRLDKALLGQVADTIRPKPDAHAMLGLAMALYGLPQAIDKGRLSDWMGVLGKARDALFSLDDPLPVLSQFASYAQFTVDAARHGVPVIAATTRDIEWNGETPEERM